MMTLEDLGYTDGLERYRMENGYDQLTVGRVVAEHKERYVVKTAAREYDAEILGNLRYTAQSRSDFPAVGDWVVFSEFDDDKGLIHAVLPRTSVLERQAIGKQGEKQIIATNIDCAFIVQAADRDFSINRIERYMAICHATGVKPVIILNKIDLVDPDEQTRLKNSVQDRLPDVPLFAVSNESREGIGELEKVFEKGKTYCLLGSSGVGKSSLMNTLLGGSHMATGEISEHSNRGKHVTTHRELRILSNGGIIIDNPGMREVGMTDTSGGLETTFESIRELSEDCRFRDCSHTTEKGCAVIAAVETGEINRESYENYLRMEREKEHFESTVAEKRKKDKEFGKMVRNIMKNKNK